MAEIVRRRSWGGVLPLGRHVSISGSSLIQCASASMAPPHPGRAKCYPGEEVQGRTGSSRPIVTALDLSPMDGLGNDSGSLAGGRSCSDCGRLYQLAQAAVLGPPGCPGSNAVWGNLASLVSEVRGMVRHDQRTIPASP